MNANHKLMFNVTKVDNDENAKPGKDWAPIPAGTSTSQTVDLRRRLQHLRHPLPDRVLAHAGGARLLPGAAASTADRVATGARRIMSTVCPVSIPRWQWRIFDADLSWLDPPAVGARAPARSGGPKKPISSAHTAPTTRGCRATRSNSRWRKEIDAEGFELWDTILRVTAPFRAGRHRPAVRRLGSPGAGARRATVAASPRFRSTGIVGDAVGAAGPRDAEPRRVAVRTASRARSSPSRSGPAHVQSFSIEHEDPSHHRTQLARHEPRARRPGQHATSSRASSGPWDCRRTDPGHATWPKKSNASTWSRRTPGCPRTPASTSSRATSTRRRSASSACASRATKAKLTIKGVTTGVTRSEFEYPLPVDDASILLDQLCEQPLIDKHRHVEQHHGRDLGDRRLPRRQRRAGRRRDRAGLRDRRARRCPPWVGRRGVERPPLLQLEPAEEPVQELASDRRAA